MEQVFIVLAPAGAALLLALAALIRAEAAHRALDAHTEAHAAKAISIVRNGHTGFGTNKV